MLYNDNEAVAVVEAEQSSEGNTKGEVIMDEELSTKGRNFKGRFLDGNSAELVDIEHDEDNKCGSNRIVEDALEKTINEVAEV